MQLAKVLGDIVATRKDAALNGITLLVIQPIDAAGAAVGRTLVAVDACCQEVEAFRKAHPMQQPDAE